MTKNRTTVPLRLIVVYVYKTKLFVLFSRIRDKGCLSDLTVASCFKQKYCDVEKNFGDGRSLYSMISSLTRLTFNSFQNDFEFLMSIGL
jgi:hypothetical protein